MKQMTIDCVSFLRAAELASSHCDPKTIISESEAEGRLLTQEPAIRSLCDDAMRGYYERGLNVGEREWARITTQEAVEQ